MASIRAYGLSMVLLMGWLTGACFAQATAQDTGQATPDASALEVARRLSEGRFSDVILLFTPELVRALPASRLAQGWGGIAASAGRLVQTGTPRSEQHGVATIVIVPLQFEKAALDLVVTFAGGRIGGLVIRPPEAPPHNWTSAAYNDPDAYRSIDVAVGTAPALPGTLLLPRASNKVAAVVLVHGSGPGDRNESVGPNRPFEDLAEGLASRGIAVLRYDKRTRVDPQSFAARAFTVQDEVIADALAAVALLRARPEIDQRRIVLLGHSLGATLAPRIAKQDPAIAGIVLLAASARPLPDVIVEQLEYLAGLDGPPDETVKARIAAVKVEADRAKKARSGDAGPPILNVPPSYWADLNAYDPVAATAELAVPMLILQGGRDYQVTALDFARFQSGLAGKSNATLKLMPSLNHLFVTGEGRSSPAEYEKPGHVDREVIDAVVRFVEQLPGP